MNRFLTSCAVLVLLGGGAGVAHAQFIYLEPVEAGTEDVNPLRSSLKSVRADLRVPTDFERVYRVTGDVRAFGGGDEEMYARVSNGLVAMFPKSVYSSRTRRAIIPPGTIWVLGAHARNGIAPVKAEESRGEVRPVDGRIDVMTNQAVENRRLKTDVVTTPRPRPTRIIEVPCIFESESVRHQRVDARLDEALHSKS
ncbi:MAG: hypothetical protein NTV94_09970 [Planctomycetota bacterium]|nr:hypothetical protein [Planctomycetota bacterium]